MSSEIMSKILPFASTAAGFIPGVGPLMSAGLSVFGNMAMEENQRKQEWQANQIMNRQQRNTNYTEQLNNVFRSGGQMKGFQNPPKYRTADVLRIAPRTGNRPNKDGSNSTHLMSYAEMNGKFVAYPTLFQNKKGEWYELSDDNDWAAMKEAEKRGELFEFNDERSAESFAGGSWKADSLKKKEYQSGGKMTSTYNQGGMLFKQYDFKSHAKGGGKIDMNGNPNPWGRAELEKQENAFKLPDGNWYIFSDHLKFK